MPSCVFKNCTNKPDSNLKIEGTTFHSFPRNAIRANQWTDIVRTDREDRYWSPSKNSVICSLHFKKEDIYLTKVGRNFLAKTAIPTLPNEIYIMEDENKDDIISNNKRPCVACLSLEGELKNIEDENLVNIFRQILYEIQELEIKIKPIVCLQCELTLQNWSIFKENVKKSYTILINEQERKDTASCNGSYITVETCPTDKIKKESAENTTDIFDNLQDGDHSDTDMNTTKPNFKRVKKKNGGKEKEENVLSLLNGVDVIDLKIEEVREERERIRSTDVYFNSRMYRCEGCLIGFLNEETLKRHNTSYHDKVMKCVCEICGCRYKDAKTLSRHQICHYKLYVCHKCGYRCQRVNSIKEHVKNHNEYVCDVCGHVSSTHFRHKTHIEKVHEKKSYCEICKKNFSTSRTYKIHMRTLHRNRTNANYQCQRCPRTYKWPSNLRRHMRNHKTVDSGENLICLECDKTFLTNATYKEHFRSSLKHLKHSELAYTCNECDKKFPNKTCLRDHINWVHLKAFNYKCTQCDKAFKSKANLRIHVGNVHKRLNACLCEICGKGYQTPAVLKDHVLAKHTDDTPHKCRYCPMSFARYSNLYRHLKKMHERTLPS